MKKKLLIIISMIPLIIGYYRSIPDKIINTSNLEQTKYVYPLGEVVNIKAETSGVLVIGYDEENVKYTNGIQIGDTICKINDIEIENVEQIPLILQESKNNRVSVLVDRDGSLITYDLELKKYNSEYKLGVWIRDKISGIGTLTYYDPNSTKFGAIGHAITDTDTNELLKLKNGKIYIPYTYSIQKGGNGKVGQIVSNITTQNEVGEFINNENFGITGNINLKKDDRQLIQVGNFNEIEIGEAYIIFEDINRNIRTYDIVIEDIDYENSQIKIKVIDEELIEYTGGIIRGMSGAPICQKNKLIGAISYVSVKDSTLGYGVFIEKMIH